MRWTTWGQGLRTDVAKEGGRSSDSNRDEDNEMREGTQRFGSFLWCWESRLYIALTAFNVHSFCVIEIENQKRQIASRMFFCGIQPRSTISLEMQTEPSLTIAVP